MAKKTYTLKTLRDAGFASSTDSTVETPPAPPAPAASPTVSSGVPDPLTVSDILIALTVLARKVAADPMLPSALRHQAEKALAGELVPVRREKR